MNKNTSKLTELLAKGFEGSYESRGRKILRGALSVIGLVGGYLLAASVQEFVTIYLILVMALFLVIPSAQDQRTWRRLRGKGQIALFVAMIALTSSVMATALWYVLEWL